MPSIRPPIVLTLAGSDPSGGAGLQADLRVFAAHRLYGTAAVAGLTVQDTRGVHASMPIEGGWVREQVDAILQDLPVAGIKTGMLGSAAAVRGLVEALERADYGGFLVVDPVLRSSSGAVLLDAAGCQALWGGLLGRATVATPNLPEARALLGAGFEGVAAEEAAHALVERGLPAVVVTGGHSEEPDQCVDWLCQVGSSPERIATHRKPSTHDHGTGCAHSAAFLCALVGGQTLREAAESAQAWVARGLEGALDLGAGRGPVFVPFD